MVTTDAGWAAQIEQVNDDYAAWNRLAGAILLQAVDDAVKGDTQAERWLRSEDCSYLCLMTGFDHRAVIRWLNQGKPLAVKLIRYVEPKDRAYDRK